MSQTSVGHPEDALLEISLWKLSFGNFLSEIFVAWIYYMIIDFTQLALNGI